MDLIGTLLKELNSQRKEEIHRLNSLSTDEFCKRAGRKLLVVDTLKILHHQFANEIVSILRSDNKTGKQTVLILPYGPTGQYPILLDLMSQEKISMKNAVLFFMDEYADDRGSALSLSHPLSFRGGMQWFWDSLDPELRPMPSNVIFPDEDNASEIQQLIEQYGGVDTCFAGVGIHGHLAFNEPQPGVRKTEPRLTHLNCFTVAMNAIRTGVGGDIANFPDKAWTLGMKQCLGARKIRIYCRNDIAGLQWANTILRLAVLGKPGDDFPVTWIRNHSDWQVVTDRNTAASPQNLL